MSPSSSIGSQVRIYSTLYLKAYFFSFFCFYSVTSFSRFSFSRFILCVGYSFKELRSFGSATLASSSLSLS